MWSCTAELRILPHCWIIHKLSKYAHTPRKAWLQNPIWNMTVWTPDTSNTSNHFIHVCWMPARFVLSGWRGLSSVSRGCLLLSLVSKQAGRKAIVQQRVWKHFLREWPKHSALSRNSLCLSVRRLCSLFYMKVFVVMNKAPHHLFLTPSGYFDVEMWR